MLRSLSVCFIMAVASYLALMVMPWWVPMPLGFLLVCMLPMKKGAAFLATGLGAAICYTLLCLFTDHANEHILSGRMAQLFHLPSYWLMTVVTVLLGFITAGLGGLTGAAFRRLLQGSKLTEDTFVREESGS